MGRGGAKHKLKLRMRGPSAAGKRDWGSWKDWKDTAGPRRSAGLDGSMAARGMADERLPVLGSSAGSGGSGVLQLPFARRELDSDAVTMCVQDVLPMDDEMATKLDRFLRKAWQTSIKASNETVGPMQVRVECFVKDWVEDCIGRSWQSMLSSYEKPERFTGQMAITLFNNLCARLGLKGQLFPWQLPQNNPIIERTVKKSWPMYFGNIPFDNPWTEEADGDMGNGGMDHVGMGLGARMRPAELSPSGYRSSPRRSAGGRRRSSREGPGERDRRRLHDSTAASLQEPHRRSPPVAITEPVRQRRRSPSRSLSLQARLNRVLQSVQGAATPTTSALGGSPQRSFGSPRAAPELRQEPAPARLPAGRRSPLRPPASAAAASAVAAAAAASASAASKKSEPRRRKSERGGSKPKQPAKRRLDRALSTSPRTRLGGRRSKSPAAPGGRKEPRRRREAKARRSRSRSNRRRSKKRLSPDGDRAPRRKRSPKKTVEESKPRRRSSNAAKKGFSWAGLDPDWTPATSAASKKPQVDTPKAKRSSPRRSWRREEKEEPKKRKPPHKAKRMALLEEDSDKEDTEEKDERKSQWREEWKSLKKEASKEGLKQSSEDRSCSDIDDVRQRAEALVNEGKKDAELKPRSRDTSPWAAAAAAVVAAAAAAAAAAEPPPPPPPPRGAKEVAEEKGTGGHPRRGQARRREVSIRSAGEGAKRRRRSARESSPPSSAAVQETDTEKIRVVGKDEQKSDWKSARPKGPAAEASSEDAKERKQKPEVKEKRSPSSLRLSRGRSSSRGRDSPPQSRTPLRLQAIRSEAPVAAAGMSSLEAKFAEIFSDVKPEGKRSDRRSSEARRSPEPRSQDDEDSEPPPRARAGAGAGGAAAEEEAGAAAAEEGRGGGGGGGGRGARVGRQEVEEEVDEDGDEEEEEEDEDEEDEEEEEEEEDEEDEEDEDDEEEGKKEDAKAEGEVAVEVEKANEVEVLGDDDDLDDEELRRMMSQALREPSGAAEPAEEEAKAGEEEGGEDAAACKQESPTERAPADDGDASAHGSDAAAPRVEAAGAEPPAAAVAVEEEEAPPPPPVVEEEEPRAPLTVEEALRILSDARCRGAPANGTAGTRVPAVPMGVRGCSSAEACLGGMSDKLYIFPSFEKFVYCRPCCYHLASTYGALDVSKLVLAASAAAC